MTYQVQTLAIKSQNEIDAMSVVYSVVEATDVDQLAARLERGFEDIFELYDADIKLCKYEIAALNNLHNALQLLAFKQSA